MAGYDFSRYAVGGAQRPDSFTGMRPQFNTALGQMFAAAQGEGVGLKVYSGYRSPERQLTLWKNALIKYGSPEVARKWVAPPGRSNHNHGTAADLKFDTPAAQEWAHKNASRFGLNFRMGNEPWHIEPAKGSGQEHDHGASPSLLSGTPMAGAPMAAPTADASLLSGAPMASAPAPLTAPQMIGAPNVVQTQPIDLVGMFAQNQADQQQAQAAKATAEATRKAALFGGGLYGPFA